MTTRGRLASLDPVIVSLAALLLLIGLAILLSATGPMAVQRAADSLYYVKRQLIFGVLPGLAAFLILAFIDYRRLRPFAFLALLVSVGLLVLVYLPGIGMTVNGARGWVHFGSLSFQPSELVKLTFLIYLAAWLERREKEGGHRADNSLYPFLTTLGVIILLLVLQPDTGSVAVIVGMSLVMYFVCGAPISWFAGLCALGAGGVAAMIKWSPYRAARFMTFLHPELDPQGVGYHINQAILAIGSGGLWGLGYGHSRQKFMYLPEVESDSLIAVTAEELGFVIMAILIVLFGALVWRCFSIARRAPDRFGTFLAAGIGSWIAIQALLNAGSMTGLLPMTGVTLPFFSHGGSSMAVILAGMGLVAGIGARAKV